MNSKHNKPLFVTSNDSELFPRVDMRSHRNPNRGPHDLRHDTTLSQSSVKVEELADEAAERRMNRPSDNNYMTTLNRAKTNHPAEMLMNRD